MAQDASVDLHDQVENLELSLSSCRSRLRACLSENAKLKLEIEKRDARELEFRERLRRVQEREKAHEDETSSHAYDLRELTYRNKQLTSDLAQAKEKYRELQVKTRSRLANLAESLRQTEQKNEHRTRRIKVAVNAIQNAVLDLQRHIGSRGFHAVNSSTANRLVNKIFEAAEDLANASSVSSSQSVKDLRNVHRKAQRSAIKGNVRRGLVSASGEDGSAELLEEVTAVCGDLERENERLRSSVDALKAQIERTRGQVEKAQLIPKYRLVIVKSRAQVASPRSQLEELTVENERLRTERVQPTGASDPLLEHESLADIKSLEHQMKRVSRKNSALTKENATLRAELADLRRLNTAREAVLEDASVTRAAFEYSTIEEDVDLSQVLKVSEEDKLGSTSAVLSPSHSPIRAHQTGLGAVATNEPEDLQSEIQKLNMDISDLQQALRSIKD